MPTNSTVSHGAHAFVRYVAIGVVVLFVTPLVASATTTATHPARVDATPSSPLPGVAAVESAVVLAQSDPDVSSGVAAQLPAEPLSMFTDASCVEEPNSSPVIHDCVFGDTSSSSTVVVYGDSFALEWVPALNEMGLLHDFRVVVYARYGCPFASVGVEDWLGTVDAGCAPFRNGVIHAITTMSPAPSLVLLSEETEHTSTAGTWGGITTEIWSEAIRVSLHRLGAPAAPIAVVLGTPYAWTDPSSCLAGNAHNATFCDTSLTAAFHQQEYASVARAVRSVGAATVNVESLFCSSSCPDVVGDTLVHSDRWHIASPYVLYAERGLISLIGCAGDTLTLQSTATRSLLGSLLPTLRQPSVRAACESASRSNL